MKKIGILSLLLFIIILLSQCRKAQPFKDDDYDQRLSGGMATVFDATNKAFGHAIPGLEAYNSYVFSKGDKGFSASFVTAPAVVFGGLGPVYNNTSCISCHHNDGKGTPTVGQLTSSMLLRISVPGTDAHGGPNPAPYFGNQLQDKALLGTAPEVNIMITYTDYPVTYPDGTTVTLRRPSYELRNPYVPLPASYAVSPRMAPPIFGLGLIEAISESTILGFADPNDADGDGISGRVNYVYNPYTRKTELGRFGLKANTSSLMVQVASAYHQDMGVTSFLFPDESAFGQSQMDGKKYDIDLPDSTLHDVTFYIRALAVPARRNVDNPVVLKGQALFSKLNCSGCHKPVIYTGHSVSIPQLSRQRIQAYTDLLLHDMGPDLADGYEDYLASGREWRTMPLWGIGLFDVTNGTPFYLHDGRARTIEEAILWHGGEAQKAKEAFMQLSKEERDAVVRFIRSL